MIKQENTRLKEDLCWRVEEAAERRVLKMTNTKPVSVIKRIEKCSEKLREESANNFRAEENEIFYQFVNGEK